MLVDKDKAKRLLKKIIGRYILSHLTETEGFENYRSLVV